MCCKKEDFIDGFSVHSIGFPDYKFPDFLCERQRNGLHVWECPENGMWVLFLSQALHRAIPHP